MAGDEIRHAVRNPVATTDMEDDRLMVVGPDRARFIEVGLWTAEDGTVVVFHAMRPARDRFLPEKVMPMPRTMKEIMDQADELARRFEAGDIPEGSTPRDARPLREVREAFDDVAHAQTRLADRISVARAEGHSWAAIGIMVGTSGEAVRQRYGQPAKPTPVEAVAKAAPPKKVATKAASAKGMTTKAAPVKSSAIKARPAKTGSGLRRQAR